MAKELENKNSQFYEMIKGRLERLWVVDKEEVIELVVWMDGWGLEVDPVVKRWAENQEFTLGEMWKLLKTGCGMADVFENMLIVKLKDSLPMEEYGTLFKILNFYRLKGLGSESFFKAMEEHFLANIKNLSATNTTSLLIHYANNTNESLESRLKIMKAVEDRIYAVSKFLNADELISVLYCYLKMGNATDTLLQ